MLFFSIARKKYYNRTLDNLLQGEANYSIFLTGSFFTDSLYLIDYFYRKNPRLIVEFYDEGTISYFNEENYLFRYGQHEGVKQSLIRFFCQGKFKYNYKRLVKGIHLYAPQLNHVMPKLVTHGMKRINENEICQQLLESVGKGIEDVHSVWYNKRNVLFFPPGRLKGYEDNYDKTYEILSAIIEAVGARKLIVKPHPTMIKQDPKKLQEFELEGIYVDNENYLFESNYEQMELNKKIFILRNSSIALNPKFMYGKEPFVIFTFRLYQYYHQNGEWKTERYASDLMSIYKDKNGL